MNPSNDVSLYPNPATTKVNITAKDAIRAISIFTMSGEEVLSKAGAQRQSETLVISLLPAGLYQVRVLAGEITSSTLLYKTE
jgi:hypothetical protein